MKGNKFLKRVISPLLFSMFLCTPNVVNARASSYDDSLWKNYKGESVAVIDGKVTTPSGGMFYDKNLADQAYFEEHNALYVKIEFEATRNEIEYLKNQVVFFINSKPMTNLDCISSFGTASATTMGPRTYLQNEDQYYTNQALFRLCDYTNYQTSTYTHIYDGDVHSFSWLVDSTGVYTYFDDTVIVKSGSSYRSQKSEGVYWTIDDFMDDKGNPQIYCGVYTSAHGWMNVHVKNIINSDGLSTINGYKGNSENLYEEDGDTLLKNNFAYVAESFDFNNPITGEIEIKEVPGYKTNLETDVETFASISLKDSNKNDTDGNGFKISFAPLSESGNERTKIDFGYISNSQYTSLKSIVTSRPIIGKHTYGFVCNGDSYSFHADGETYWCEIFSDPKIMTMDIKFGKAKTYLYFSLDNKISLPYEGDWIAKLSMPHTISDGDVRVIGNSICDISGESTTSKVEINSKEYNVYSANKTVSFENTSGVIGFTSTTSLPIYNKVNNLMTTTVSFDDVNNDAELTILFSATPGGSFTKDVTTSCFMIRIKLLSGDKANVHCEMDFDSIDKEISVSNKKMEITFGWEDNSSVIKIDGNFVQSGLTGTGGFATAKGLEGFFSAKYVSEEPISFSISLPTQSVTEIEEKPGPTSESTTSISVSTKDSSSQETNPSEITSEEEKPAENKKGCKSSVYGCGFVAVIGLVLIAALTILKKKEKMED